MKKFSEDDDLIFEYNREKLMMDDMKEVLTKEVTERVTKEVTEKTTLDMARKLKLKDINISDIMDVTGLSREVIESL